jgi:alpha-beta hydrolase superfamily lysophospholipase
MPEFTRWAGGQVGYLDTSDGRLAYRYWDEAGSAARTLLGIHGIGGNNDNYIALGEALKPDVAVYAIDLAGSGESGTPGDVASRDAHLRNLDTLAALIRARHPGARHYLAGFSLGVAYASVWLARNGNTCDGLILFAPPFRNIFKLPPHIEVAFRVLSRLAPSRRIRVARRSGDKVDARYRFEMDNDKFIRERTLRMLKVSADVVPAGERALSRVTIPTLIIHGDADTVAFPEGARLTYQRLGAADKTLHWIPGAKHDLYDVMSGIRSDEVKDEQRVLVIQKVREWLEEH